GTAHAAQQPPCVRARRPDVWGNDLMPFVSGPVGVLLVAGTVATTFLVWLLRDRRYPGPRLHGDSGIDQEELEAAEQEVRDLRADQRPDEDVLGDDWGPRAARPRPPVRL